MHFSHVSSKKIGDEVKMEQTLNLLVISAGIVLTATIGALLIFELKHKIEYAIILKKVEEDFDSGVITLEEAGPIIEELSKQQGNYILNTAISLMCEHPVLTTGVFLLLTYNL